ncbi:MAG: sugar phosphate nucleotidyltransferase [Candidatus Lokiarchaeota archaeon]
MTEYLLKHYSDYFNLQFREQKPMGYEAEIPYFSGLGDAILLGRDLAEGDDCFIFLSDRLPLENYTPVLLNYHQEKCDGVINVKRVDNPQFYGVTVLDKDGCITKIVEKPQDFISDFAVSGAYLFGKNMTPRLFELLEEQSKVEIVNGEEHLLTPIIQQLIDEGYKIKVNEMKEEILDFGRPESLLQGNRLLLSEIKLIDPLFDNLFKTGSIIDSKIVPPVYIGENVKIRNSVIGPNVSLGDNLVLEKCILNESVIGDGTELKKIISSNSIIGDYSILEDLIKKGITIGDSSYITTSNMKSF